MGNVTLCCQQDTGGNCVQETVSSPDGEANLASTGEAFGIVNAEASVPFKVKEEAAVEEGLEREKALLKATVESFAQRAVRGVKTSIVDMQSGNLISGSYFVDQALHNFMLRPETSASRPPDAPFETCVPFKQVTHLHGDGAWPTSLEFPGRPKLADESSEKLAVVQYSLDDARGDSEALALILDNAESCRTFLTCMDVLRLYNA